MIKRLLLASFVLLLIGCGGTPPTEQPNPTTPAVDVAPTEAVADTTDTASAEPTEPGLIQPTATPAPPTATPTPLPTEVPTATPTPLPTIPAEVEIEVPGAILPPGFSLVKFAEMNRPIGIAIDDNGHVYVTNQDGNIFVLADEDGDGRADLESQFSFGWIDPFGVAFHPDPDNNDIYVSSEGKISIVRDLDGDLVADEAVNFVNNLPYDRHRNNNLKFGPDGWLYMGVGSTCDVCYEVDERSATIMRFNIETGESEVYASGLRNAFDLAWHPESGELFATENGRDDLGPENPLEELNHIVQNADYGFPDCWNSLEGPDCNGTTMAAGFFQARSSTNSLSFYDQSGFPEEYQNALFAGVWGSYEADVKRGIWQVRLAPNGDTFAASMDWFVEWPNAWLLGMAVGPDGALYVGDYINGGIYRISYGLP